jgi:hypothetical protein
MSSPLTTAGDILIFSTSNDRLPVGTNGQVLVARSTSTYGASWEPNAGGGDASMIYIGGASATATSSTSVTVSSIPQTASDLIIIVQSVTTTSGTTIEISLNTSTTVGYEALLYNNNGTISSYGRTDRLPEIFTGPSNTLTAAYIELNGYTNTTRKSGYYQSIGGKALTAGSKLIDGVFSLPETAAITSLVIKIAGAVGTGGFIYVDIWATKRS